MSNHFSTVFLVVKFLHSVLYLLARIFNRPCATSDTRTAAQQTWVYHTSSFIRRPRTCLAVSIPDGHSLACRPI